MKLLILAILYLFFPFRPMRQDNPPPSERRMPKTRPSRYQFSTANLPYRPLSLTRHRVVMPISESAASVGPTGKRLLLVAIILGFGAVWLHGGAARQVLTWLRQTVTEDAGKRLALESGK